MGELVPNEEPLESLEKYYQKLLDKDQDDIALTIGAYTLSFIGSAIGPFLVQVAPILTAASASIGPVVHNIVFGRKLERIDEFHQGLIAELKRIIEDIYADNKEMKERIEERVKTEDFGYLYARSLDSCVSRKRKEKARFYQNLLINHLISDNHNINLEEVYISKLDDLSYIELVVLSWFHSDQAKPRTGDVNEENEAEKKRRLKLVEESIFSDKEIDYAITVLDNKGYFEHQMGVGGANFVWQFWNFRGWLNEMSIDFLDYILTIRPKGDILE